MTNLNWTLDDFSRMDALTLYKILQSRARVFVVEQNCNYLDPDGLDMNSLHLCGWNGKELIAYARLIPPGISYEAASIGRVLICKDHRRYGLGNVLMKKAIEETLKHFNTSSIHISAQYYLLEFYTRLGFVAHGEQYLEDDIPHIGMDYTGNF